MKILIFGGTGFLGKNLIDRLIQDGFEIGVYIRPTTCLDPYIERIEKYVKIHVGEFSQEKNFANIVDGYDCIFHLIGTSVPGMMDPLEDIETTIKPSLRLIEGCVKKNNIRIVFFSSGGTVYGMSRRIPIKENDYGQPISAYGIQKFTLERYFELYQYYYGIDIKILRIGNPYGKYQKPFLKQGLIANLLGKYFMGAVSDIWRDGNVVRDYIYVDDLLDAVVKLLSYGGKESIFNIGYGKGVSVNQIISTISKIVGEDIPVKRKQSRKIDVPINILDISRAEQELLWHPTIELEDGIRKMISYWNPNTKLFDLNL